MFQFDKINKLNLKPKKGLTRLCAKYANKFYVYNGGIHQIVRLDRSGFSGIDLLIQKPSGKYTCFTTTIDHFQKREVFDTFDEAARYLISVWQKNCKVPLRRIDYIKELELKYLSGVV